MRLMVTKILKFGVIFSFAASSFAIAGGNGSSKGSGDFHPQITTLDGDHFYHAEVIKADPNGLLFRHSAGIAKVKFTNLSESLRVRYDYDAGQAAEFTNVKAKPAPVVRRIVRPAQPKAYRVVKPSCQEPRCNIYTGGAGLPYPFYLANYHCRKQAELDFLYTAGLLPKPPGVRTRILHRY